MPEKSIHEEIKNSNLVTNYFGYWPTFHDDSIVDVINDYKNRSLKIKVQSTVKTNRGNNCIITFLFKEVKEIKIDYYVDIPIENFIFELKTEKIDSGLIKTIFEPSTGIYCVVISKEVEVEKIEVL